MLGIVNYGAFVASTVALCLTPGIDTVYILTRSLAGGRREGVASALGINTGLLVHTVLVATGLSLLLSACAPAFFAVKLCGAAYLVVMGIKSIVAAARGEAGVLTVGEGVQASDPRKTYLQGVATNVLNPKIVLFFLALLPQFVSPANAFGPVPFLVLGLTYVVFSTVWTLVLVMASAPLSGWLSSNESAGRVTGVVSGLVYMALGAMVFATKS